MYIRIYIYICMYIYIYIYMHAYFSLSLSLYIYIYMQVEGREEPSAKSGAGAGPRLLWLRFPTIAPAAHCAQVGIFLRFSLLCFLGFALPLFVFLALIISLVCLEVVEPFLPSLSIFRDCLCASRPVTCTGIYLYLSLYK